LGAAWRSDRLPPPHASSSRPHNAWTRDGIAGGEWGAPGAAAGVSPRRLRAHSYAVPAGGSSTPSTPSPQRHRSGHAAGRAASPAALHRRRPPPRPRQAALRPSRAHAAIGTRRQPPASTASSTDFDDGLMALVAELEHPQAEAWAKPGWRGAPGAAATGQSSPAAEQPRPAGQQVCHAILAMCIRQTCVSQPVQHASRWPDSHLRQLDNHVRHGSRCVPLKVPCCNLAMKHLLDSP
jgi:hypothetical protein